MNPQTKPKCVLCYSGGLDSTVLLYQLRKEGYDVHPLIVYYGQRHAKELDAANKILGHLDIAHLSQSLHLNNLLPILKGSSQTSYDKNVRSFVDVPDGHYTDETMKATVVPNRNMILLSLATAWAISLQKQQSSDSLPLKAPIVAYAAHAGDHAIYHDCRIDFVHSLRHTMWLCDESKPELYTPFIAMTKTNIVQLGAELGVPFEKTYSCYKGGEKHCGKCGTCTERREAFKLAGIPDPTEYEE